MKQGEWLEVIAGARYDSFSLNGSGNFVNACGPFAVECIQPFSVDKNEWRFSPTFTVAVTPFKGLQVYGKYAEGFRPPQIMETLQYGRHIGNGIVFAPNPNLLPEVSKTFEAGGNAKFDNVFFQGDGLRAKAAIFETTVDNFITTGVGRYPQAGTYRRPGTDRVRVCESARSDDHHEGLRTGGILRCWAWPISAAATPA